jgi:hypothetical protein
MLQQQLMHLQHLHQQQQQWRHGLVHGGAPNEVV